MIRKSKMSNKKNALIYHVCKRLKQRYNIEVNEQQIKDMANLCKNNKCQHIEKISNTKSIKIINFNNKTIPVIYDNERHLIITVLTNEMLENREEFLKNKMED